MVHRCPGNCLLQQAFIEFQSCTSVCYRVLYINVRVGYCIISPTAAFGQESIDSTATLPSAEACLYRWQYIQYIIYTCFLFRASRWCNGYMFLSFVFFSPVDFYMGRQVSISHCCEGKCRADGAEQSRWCRTLSVNEFFS